MQLLSVIILTLTLHFVSATNEWYPPVGGLDNLSTCGLECLMTANKDWNVLKACLTQSQLDPTKIVGREDGDVYNEARQTFDGYLTQYPALVIYAHSKDDVSDAVRCATESGYPASASGGRHTTMGIIDGYVTVDTSNLTATATIDEDTNTLTIPSGFTGGMVLNALHTLAPSNAVVAVGEGGSVGYAGFIITGGMGYATPNVGMACDTLVEIEMVLYNGTTIRASKSQNQDILWATCGGGGGLGILTEMKIKYGLPMTEKFSYGTVSFARQPTLTKQSEMISDILDFFSSPLNTNWGGVVKYDRDIFQLDGLYVGSSKGLENTIQKLGFNKYGIHKYELDETSSFAQASMYHLCSSMHISSFDQETWTEISSLTGRSITLLKDDVNTSHFCNQSDVQNTLLTIAKDRSSFINWATNPISGPADRTTDLSLVPHETGKYRLTPNLSPKYMEELLQVLQTREKPGKLFRLNSGVSSKIPKDSTAFAWRGSPIGIMVYDNRMMEILQAANPGEIGGYYGLSDHGNANWQHNFYGSPSNYLELGRIRAIYDPLNTFGKTFTPGQYFDNEKLPSMSGVSRTLHSASGASRAPSSLQFSACIALLWSTSFMI